MGARGRVKMGSENAKDRELKIETQNIKGFYKQFTTPRERIQITAVFSTSFGFRVELQKLKRTIGLLVKRRSPEDREISVRTSV